MAEHQVDDQLFDYRLYRFGRSRQVFRGPQPDLRGKYAAFIGGSNTFGRFSDQPYPQLVGAELGMTAFNLGTEGAGPGFFLGDPEVLRAASDAEICVVQVMCAAAMSNRMFTVRPRRNNRLHATSEMIQGIFPEVDFSRFAFVQAMLKYLHALDDNRFKLVVNEMKNAWIGRMQTLLTAIETPTILFWFSQRDPDDARMQPGTASRYPHFVDRAMIDAVRPAADAYIECTTTAGMPQDLRVDGKTVLFKPSGEAIDENRESPAPERHAGAEDILISEIKRKLR